IAAPTHAGQRGHPVAFGATHLAALARLAGDQGARALLQAHPVTLVPTDDPGTIRDVDTPGDLAEPGPGGRDAGAAAEPPRS
ncbi:MAG: NTP transferase domain-containing protein, partial [Burkholderiales bacterium]